jgi:phosphomannomutase
VSADSDDSAVDELLAQAEAWRDDDPDPLTRSELSVVIESARGGDMAAVDDLRDRFSGLLEFGTAGLRGELGAGPHRMNQSVVIRAAAGLAAYLQGQGKQPSVVIGYDARHNSDVFARDTAAVVTAVGGSAMVLPHRLPTPVLAFAIRHLGCDAGVMVTASHNPPRDNGYKVYLGDGSQIVPPADAGIADAIVAIERTADVPLAEDGWVTLDDEPLLAYLDGVAAVPRPDTPRDLSIVHTPLHGVGRDVLVAALVKAGFAAPYVVVSQGDPDPDFPTVAFPNPEEPGAIDAALDAARARGADIVLANDPDADRCAVAVPDDSADGGWRMLRGDEVGVLLGAHLIERGVPDGAVFANSIVSSRWLAALCADAGIRHEETLTGFKWIGRVPGLHYGYEEALGYCVDPARVRDKDGVSAALLMAELAAGLKAAGRTLPDRLDELAARHGLYQSDQLSVRVDDLAQIGAAMQHLREHSPSALGGSEVTQLDDLEHPTSGLPPTDGLRFLMADGSRVIVRPSGTEPKLKCYLEVIVPVDSAAGGPAQARRTAAGLLARLRDDVSAAIGLG